MKTEKELLNDIDLVTQKPGNCLCTWYESCEACDPNSRYNKLRKVIREILHGPDPRPSVEDYGKIIELRKET